MKSNFISIFGVHGSFGMDENKKSKSINSKLKVIKKPVYAENWFIEKWRTDDMGFRCSYLGNQNIQELGRCKSSKNLNRYHITDPTRYRYTLKRNGEELISLIRNNDGSWNIVDETKIWYVPEDHNIGWIALMEVSAFKRFVRLSKDDFYDKNLDTLSEILATGGISRLLIHFLENFVTCYNAFCKGELPEEKGPEIYESLLGFDSFYQTLRNYRISLGLEAEKNEDGLFSKLEKIKGLLVNLMNSNGNIKI